MNLKYNISKNYLIKEYINNEKSTPQIAKDIGCCPSVISRKLKYYNIRIRNLREASLLIRKRMIGNNNPMKRPEIRKKLSRLLKGRIISKSWRRKIARAIKKWLSDPTHHWAYGKKYPEQSKRMRGNQLGYKHGNGYAPYPLEFNKQLKESIRKRDNYTCQKCGKKGIHVHHIDYNKQNCKEDNLITLCMKCNVKANWNVDYWYAYYRYIMENR
jgi:hypothetical protein